MRFSQQCHHGLFGACRGHKSNSVREAVQLLHKNFFVDEKMHLKFVIKVKVAAWTTLLVCLEL